MSAPTLTNDQRRQGAAKSLATRQLRREVKATLGYAERGARASALRWAFQEAAAQGMRVRSLLLALPHVGPKRADAMLTKAGIDPSRTVARIGPKQRERLLALLR